MSPGHSVQYLTREVAAGRENYYTGAVAEGEPPGRWYGRGAEVLGLRGLVDHRDMEALYEHFLDPRNPNFRDRDRWGECSTLGHKGRAYKSADELYAQALNAEPYADAERREQLRTEALKNERHNVAFMDFTYSVPKSVTVLHAAFEHQQVQARKAGELEAEQAWAAHKQAVVDAIWAGNNAGLDYLEERAAISRVGHHGGGAGRFIDVNGLTFASFLQHTNRDNEPHLHIHNAAQWRAQGADGQWRTLDSRALQIHRPAAAAIAERTTSEHMARSLRVLSVMRPDGKSREILGIDRAVCELFSGRAHKIGPETAKLSRLFEQRYGREPNALERRRLQLRAWAITRPRKSHNGERLEQRLDRWERHLRAEIKLGLDQVAADVLALAGKSEPTAQTFSPDAVAQIAIADVQSRKAAWTEADLVRAINDALPDYLGGLSGAQVQQLFEHLTRQAISGHCVSLTVEGPAAASLPAALRLANGAPAYQRPGAHLYATTEHARSERALRAAAIERAAPAMSRTKIDRFLADRGATDSEITLGIDQAAAVRGVLSSGAGVESLVGPAGTGKSFVLGAIAQAWQDRGLWDGQQRRVFGLASSQIATEVLTGEGLAARNITQWLAVQQRLAEGRPFGDDHDWQLAAGDLVVIDESAMTNTADLAAVHELVAAAGGKLLLSGDHRQLAAVGAGGGMDMIARVAPAYELAEVRRFTHAWERQASLRLREGDQGALHDYRKHGRIIDGGPVERTERLATRAWLADHLAGKHALLIVDTNEQADRLAAQVRAELVRLGRVAEHGVPLGRQDTIAGVGDLVQSRHNAWHLKDYEGNRRGPINRETYRVLDTREDGGLIVAPILGHGAGDGSGEQLGQPMSLPGAYVNEHLALGYACTVHAAQGRTVETSHTIATGRTQLSALYPAVTRGRNANTVYQVTQAVPDDAPPGTVNSTPRQDPLGVLVTAAERAEPDLAAIVHAEHNQAEAASLATIGDRFADACELATAGRTATLLDRLVDDGMLTAAQRATLAADEGTVSLVRVVRQAELAGHRPESVLRDAIAGRDLGDARSLASVIHHRISQTVDLHPKGDSYRDWTPQVDDPAWQAYLDQLATLADRRREQLGRDAADAPPSWASEAFGPVPADAELRDRWMQRASAVAAHRELTGHDGPAEALPGPPERGQVEAYASWCAAWRALGRDEASREEAEMSDGQLRIRVRAYEREQAWAPDYVAPDLSGTLQAASRHRISAELLAAEAAVTDDREQRAQLDQQAADAAALADVLDQQVTKLEHADQARSLWYAHTAGTRAAAERACAELGHRGINPNATDDDTTSEQLLADQRAGLAADDQHRELSGEHELSDVAAQCEADLRVIQPAPPADVADTDVPDVRDLAAGEGKRPTRDEHDWTRVPTADQTADSITRAQRALAEMQRRDAADQRRQHEEQRVAQLARWHHDDVASEQARAAHHEDVRGVG
jgi:conjugative relaxase-like TrwC/TraI family protein